MKRSIIANIRSSLCISLAKSWLGDARFVASGEIERQPRLLCDDGVDEDVEEVSALRVRFSICDKMARGWLED